MARFYWDNDTSENLISTKETVEVTGSQEFLLSDLNIDSHLHDAQVSILRHFSDSDIIFKIKGNLSKLMLLEGGYNTPVPLDSLLRGLDSMVREADQRVRRSPWEHESLKDISNNLEHFFSKLSEHPETPLDVREKIGSTVLARVTYKQILEDIFDISIDDSNMPKQAKPESLSKIALENTMVGVALTKNSNADAASVSDISKEITIEDKNHLLQEVTG